MLEKYEKLLQKFYFIISDLEELREETPSSFLDSGYSFNSNDDFLKLVNENYFNV